MLQDDELSGGKWPGEEAGGGVLVWKRRGVGKQRSGGFGKGEQQGVRRGEERVSESGRFGKGTTSVVPISHTK
jgi:hypothetical protein